MQLRRRHRHPRPCQDRGNSSRRPSRLHSHPTETRQAPPRTRRSRCSNSASALETLRRRGALVAGLQPHTRRRLAVDSGSSLRRPSPSPHPPRRTCARTDPRPGPTALLPTRHQPGRHGRTDAGQVDRRQRRHGVGMCCQPAAPRLLSGFERSWCRRQLCDPRKGSTRRPPVPHTIHQSRPSAMPTESCLGTPRNVGFDRLAADGKAGNAGAARGVHTKFSSPSPDGTFGLALASRALTPHTQIRRGRSCHHPAAPPHAHHTSSATFTLAPRPPSSSLRPFPRPQRRAISTQGFIPRRWSATPLRHKQPHESPPLDPHRPEARPIPETPSCLSEP